MKSDCEIVLYLNLFNSNDFTRLTTKIFNNTVKALNRVGFRWVLRKKTVPKLHIRNLERIADAENVF